jgi:hypothetical protein
VSSASTALRATLAFVAVFGSFDAVHSATITLVPGAGFNDATVVSPEGGNPGTTLGQQRTNLFNAAAAIWAGKLTSSQTIKIQASFETLTCNASSGVLGSAGATSFFTLGSGADERFFPVALAEALDGSNLNDADNEIIARFNARIDLNDTGCLGNTRWYYGLTGPAPNGTIALFPTLLHELGHGLGFQTLLCTTAGGCTQTNPVTPQGGYFFGIPDIWADFLRDNSGGNTLWVDLSNAQRITSFTSDPLLVWDGAVLNARIAALGLSGAQLNESRLRMYAPSPFEPGSSLSHFSDAATPNLLMEPSLNDDLFDQTDLTDCLFDDIGWVQNGCSSNTAPTLNPARSPALAAVAEDAAAPVGAVGTLVSALVDFAVPAGQVDNVTDPEAGALLGIAITANDNTGSWFFSTNNGSNWTALGAVSATSARLLAADAGTRLYFQPNANVNGSIASAITFRAWDRTSGTAGALVNPTPNGGSSAFSSATDTASLSVTAVNDAPVLDASRSPAFAALAEDSAAPTGAVGTLVSSLVDFASPSGQIDNVTDPDTSPVLGIAIVGANASDGTWHFSTNNGGNWSPLGTPGTTTARLLLANANNRLYFQPSANFNGSINDAITLRAWDSTSGADGATANTSTNGGSSAFSLATDTVSLSVTPVNDAPVLNAGASPTLAAIAEDAPAPSGGVGTLVSTLVDLANPSGQLDNVTDIDGTDPLGIAIIDADATNGTWLFSTNGASWIALGTPGATSARLLTANATTRIYFQPNANFNGSVASALTFRAWDGSTGSNGATVNPGSGGGTSAYSTTTDTISIAVPPVNDAPVLDPSRSPTLNPVSEDAAAPSGPAGTPVMALVDQNISDIDAAAVTGLAIVAVDSTNGDWFYTTNDGGNWFPLTNVLSSNARLLNASISARVYFRPAPNFSGTIADALTFRAWDQTTGTDGGIANTNPGGGTSAFSSATDTASIEVFNVNDPPSLSSPATASGDEDTVQSINLTVADPDAATLTIELGASVGFISLGSVGGLSFDIGDGASDPQMRFTGSIGAINSAISTIFYRADPDYHGDAQLTFSATDNIVPTSSSRIVAITVFSVVDVRDDTITAIAGVPRTFNTLTGLNGGSPDNFAGPAQITSVTQGANGSVTFLADGTLTYTADIAHVGPDAFQYTASSGGFTEVGNVSVNVEPPSAEIFGDGFEEP